jgi:hypothetical protein
VFQAQHFHFDAQLVARHNRFAEFGFVDRSEKHDLAAGVRGERADQDAGRLSHGFDDQDAGHDWETGKMSGEMRLVDRDVLQPNDRIRRNFDDAVDHEHGVAMRQELRNFLYIERCHGNGYYNNR